LSGWKTAPALAEEKTQDRERAAKEETRNRERADREEARNRERARGVAVAIYPELLQIEVALDRAAAILKTDPSKNKGNPNAVTANFIRQARLTVPPMLELHIKRLHWLPGDTGATVLQLVSVLKQFDGLVAICVRQIEDRGLRGQSAVDHGAELDGHLTALQTLIREAKTKVGAWHEDRPHLVPVEPSK
jgi:hypothetical protein